MSKDDILKIKMSLVKARFDLASAEHEVLVSQKKLEQAQMACEHKFAKPELNFEHEGGHCEICGINELYFQTLKGQ
jgi:hypothetical protein